MKKSDIYRFLRNKRMEIITKTITPLQEEIDREKEAYVNSLNIDFAEIAKLNTSLESLYESIVERPEIERFYFSAEIRTYHNYNTIEKLKKDVTNSIRWRSVKGMDLKFNTLNDLTSELTAEFDKLESLVKSCKTAKRAYEELQRLGFDMSTLEVEQPMEVALTSINSSLLGLPEKGENK